MTDLSKIDLGNCWLSLRRIRSNYSASSVSPVRSPRSRICRRTSTGNSYLGELNEDLYLGIEMRSKSVFILNSTNLLAVTRLRISIGLRYQKR
ncbi:MAG: hypothetical protein WBB29_09550 [Geitlerinemataceae cyanobacterium]